MTAREASWALERCRDDGGLALAERDGHCQGPTLGAHLSERLGNDGSHLLLVVDAVVGSGKLRFKEGEADGIFEGLDLGIGPQSVFLDDLNRPVSSCMIVRVVVEQCPKMGCMTMFLLPAPAEVTGSAIEKSGVLGVDRVDRFGQSSALGDSQIAGIGRYLSARDSANNVDLIPAFIGRWSADSGGS